MRSGDGCARPRRPPGKTRFWEVRGLPRHLGILFWWTPGSQGGSSNRRGPEAMASSGLTASSAAQEGQGRLPGAFDAMPPGCARGAA